MKAAHAPVRLRVVKSNLLSRFTSAGAVKAAALLLLVGLLATTFYSPSSASSGPAGSPFAGASAGIGARSEGLPVSGLNIPSVSSFANFNMLLAVESVDVTPPATRAAGCSSPAFLCLGEIATATVTNAPLRVGFRERRIQWIAPDGSVVQVTDVITDPQIDTYSLPTSGKFAQVGTWTVRTVNNRLGGVAITTFEVRAPSQPSADLALALNGPATVAAGDAASYTATLTNNGPDAADNIVLENPVPFNSTFASATPASGFTCDTPPIGEGGTILCTGSTLAANAQAVFVFTFTIDDNVKDGTSVVNVAKTGTSTNEPNRRNNFDSVVSTSAPAGTGTGVCTLTCPGDVVVTANTTQGGTPGRFVNYGAAAPSGNCGTITNTPISGSFFAVGGPYTVTSTATGTSCTFTVTVLGSDAPTISCPADQSVTAADGQDTATVSVGTPTTTPATGVTVHGERSDELELTDPYPIGTTGILWTATDAAGRTATCKQKIVVNSNACGTDNQPPVIVSNPPDITVGTGPGNTGCSIALDDELGQFEVDDNCVLTRTITGIPANNAFPIGTTDVVYTATDPGGHSVTHTQQVTVVDDTPPVIAAPADATYSCLNDVPAASPSQATRGEVLDDDGNPLPPGAPFDNCGVPVVTVTESSTGVGNAASPKVITRVFTATDTSPAHNSSSATQVITVIDSQAPTITAPLDVVANTGAGATSCGATVSLGTPTTGDNCAGVTVTRSPSSNTFPVGTTDVVWTATDAVGNTSNATQHVTVNDNTVPTITAPTDKTLYTGAGATSCGVTVSNLDATLGTATAADNCAGVTWARGGSNVFPLGDTFVTYTATDAHGNTAIATQKVTVVDNTPPVVTAPANITVYLPLNSSATSMAVTYPNPATATDNCSGTITFNYSPASGSTFSVGTTTVTVTATDAHSNSASATFTVTVLYDFTGFFSPISNSPTLNSVNAGRAIPIKFSLSGDKGLNIFAAGSPSTVSLNCSSSDPGVDVTETVNAGGSSLSYGGGQYNYVWKTESSWAGTCRQLRVTLNDGTVHVANFKFK